MKINKVSTPHKISVITQAKETVIKSVATPAKQTVKQTERQSSHAVMEGGTAQITQKIKNDSAPARTLASAGVIMLAQKKALKNYEKFMDGPYVNQNKQIVIKTDMGMKAISIKSDEAKTILGTPELREQLVSNKEAIAHTINYQGISVQKEAFEIGKNTLEKKVNLHDYGGNSTVFMQNMDKEAAHVAKIAANYKTSYGTLNRVLSSMETRKNIQETAREAIKNNVPIDQFIKQHQVQNIEIHDPLNPKVEADPKEVLKYARSHASVSVESIKGLYKQSNVSGHASGNLSRSDGNKTQPSAKKFNVVKSPALKTSSVKEITIKNADGNVVPLRINNPMLSNDPVVRLKAEIKTDIRKYFGSGRTVPKNIRNYITKSLNERPSSQGHFQKITSPNILKSSTPVVVMHVKNEKLDTDVRIANPIVVRKLLSNNKVKIQRIGTEKPASFTLIESKAVSSHLACKTSLLKTSQKNLSFNVIRKLIRINKPMPAMDPVKQILSNNKVKVQHVGVGTQKTASFTLEYNKTAITPKRLIQLHLQKQKIPDQVKRIYQKTFSETKKNSPKIHPQKLPRSPSMQKNETFKPVSLRIPSGFQKALSGKKFTPAKSGNHSNIPESFGLMDKSNLFKDFKKNLSSNAIRESMLHHGISLADMPRSPNAIEGKKIKKSIAASKKQMLCILLESQKKQQEKIQQAQKTEENIVLTKAAIKAFVKLKEKTKLNSIIAAYAVKAAFDVKIITKVIPLIDRTITRLSSSQAGRVVVKATKQAQKTFVVTSKVVIASIKITAKVLKAPVNIARAVYRKSRQTFSFVKEKTKKGIIKAGKVVIKTTAKVAKQTIVLTIKLLTSSVSKVAKILHLDKFIEKMPFTPALVQFGNKVRDHTHLMKMYTDVLRDQVVHKVIPTLRDRKLVWMMERKARQLERMTQYTSKRRVVGKMGTGILRIFTQPLNQSEAMQGYRIFQGASMPAKPIMKFTGKMTGRVAFKIIQNYKVMETTRLMRIANIRNASLSKEAARRLARRQVESSFGKHYTTNFFTNRFKSKVRDTVLNAAANITAGKGSFFAKSINAQVQATRDLGLDGRNAAKKVRKQIRRDFKRKKELAKGTSKIVKPKTGGKIQDGANNLLKIGQKAFKETQKAITAFFNFLKGILAPLGGLAVPAMIGVVILALVLLIFFIWYIFMGDYAGEMSSVVWFKGEEAQTSEFNDAMSHLQAKHTSMVKKIQSEQQKYEVADVQYTNGTQENYKEILSATHVIFQNQPYDFDSEYINDVIDKLYDQTHQITTEEYTFKENDGSTKKAAHVFVNIKRNEELCYSALDGIMSSGGSSTVIANYCPAGSVTNTDWINIVKTVKSLIASTGTEYSQTTTVPISVNGVTHNVRPDCSGYVSICLELFGSFSANQKYSSYQFVSESSIKGFTKYAWSGWDNLQEGDIIATNGHVEIFAYNSGGKHYVYSNGSTPSVRTPGVTTDNVSYITVWRPASAGSTGSTNNTGNSGNSAQAMSVTAQEEYLLACIIDAESGGEPYQGQLAVGSVILNRVASLKFPNTITDVVYQSGQFSPVTDGHLEKKLKNGPSNSCVNAAKEVLSGTRVVNNLYFQTTSLANKKGITGTVIGNHTFHGETINVAITNGSNGSVGSSSNPYDMIKFSNMPSVDFNKQDNQSGYETALKNTITAFSRGSRYSAANFKNKNQAHYKSDSEQSSLDFVRAVYANHGVSIAFSMAELHDQFTLGSYKNLSVGDIILYRPSINEAWSIKKIDNAYNKAKTDKKRQQALKHYDYYVPMIYIGNNKVVAYSNDLTQKGASYKNSSGKVRTYTIGKDLSKSRIAEIRHVTKILNNKIYGADNFFCGWTDDMIAQMITCLDGSYWISKKVECTGSKGETLSVDFFASYVEDYFDGDVAGNSVYSTSTHDQTFVDDISRIALLSYENYTILPSYLVADAVLKSNNRTTEESLKYFNIYEKLSDSGETVTKYTYDSSGNPSATGVGYAKYSSLTDALNDHCKDINSKYSVGSATKYSTLTSILANSGYCSSGYASEMNSYISSNNLTNLDTIAVTRKKYMDDATSKCNSMDKVLKDYSSSSTASGYKKIKEAETSLQKSQKVMDDYITDTDTSTVKSQNLDKRINEALKKASDARAAQIKKQVDKAQKANDNLSKIVESYGKKSSLSAGECKKLGSALEKAKNAKETLNQYMTDIDESDKAATDQMNTIDQTVQLGQSLIKKQLDVYVKLADNQIDSLNAAIHNHAGKSAPSVIDYNTLINESNNGAITNNNISIFLKNSGLSDSRLTEKMNTITGLCKQAVSEAKKLDETRKNNISISKIQCAGHYYSKWYTLYHNKTYPEGRLYRNGRGFDNDLGTDVNTANYCNYYTIYYNDGWK